MSFKRILTNIFLYKEPPKTSNFSLPEDNNNNESYFTEESTNKIPKLIYPKLSLNVDYIKVKYNSLINSDIKIREFKLNINGKEYDSILLFIDGMINSESINNFILKPIMSKNNYIKKRLSIYY